MIVIARRYGQLGNRLFLYAHLIAAARHYGVPLINPCFAEYADWFPSTRHRLFCRYDAHLIDKIDRSQRIDRSPRRVTRRAMTIGVETLAKTMHTLGLRHGPAEVIRLKSGEPCDLESERFSQAVQSGRTVLVQGWLFRSPRLLQAHQSSIREFFALAASDQSAIDQTLSRARRECDLLVGVHIRRGDYADFHGGRYYYQDEDYSKWMHAVREQMPGQRVQFLVCSHEALDETKFTGLEITRGPGSALRDMYALAETDWMIGPPSTFTSWASFIGKKPRVELRSADQALIVPHETSEPAAAA